MRKLKEIERLLKKDGHSFHRSENNQQIYIYWCCVGNNFYDYGKEKPKTTDYSFAPYVKDDPRIILITCEDCCRCAGW